MKRLRTLFGIAIIFSITTGQDNNPSCPLNTNDFSQTQLFKKTAGAGYLHLDDLEEPIAMDFVPIMSGDSIVGTSLYFIQRNGELRFFDGNTNTVNAVGNVPVRFVNFGGHGLRGIALHPDFKNNNQMFLWYSVPVLENGVEKGSAPADRFYRHVRLSRFLITAQNTLDLNSEKILIDDPKSGLHEWTHHGGPMTFDSHGDLWITYGNNSTDHNQGHLSNDSQHSDEWGSSNTASMRGSILRIHPDESQKGYTIPKNNFAEYWAGQFESQGKTILAAQYRDPTKVLPEIYTKGHRSNFSVAVHSTKRWLAWGEVNFQSNLDEMALTTIPVFAGYPYFHGDKVRTSGHTRDINLPYVLNESSLKSGVDTLPPHYNSPINSLANVAITGPIYTFDSTLKSDKKFPPQFHEWWFNMGFNRNIMWVSKISADGQTVGSPTQINGSGLFSFMTLYQPLMAKFGPEGALYVINYNGSKTTGPNTGIIKIEYNGNCAPVVPMGIGVRKKIEFGLSNNRIIIQGRHELTLYSLSGERIIKIKKPDSQAYNFDVLQKNWKINNGMVVIKISANGENIRKKLLLNSN